MKIGVIGAGKIGGTVGRLWIRAGHQVRFGVRRPEASQARDGETFGTIEEAVAFGDVVFAALPYGAWPELSKTIAPALAGKVLIDAANPYPERDGAFAQTAIDAGRGAGEPVARLLPSVRLVRGLNSVFWRTLEDEAHRAGNRVGIPLASNDAEALSLASQLVRDAGFDPVEVGPLFRAREFDPGAAVYNSGMSGPELRAALGRST